MFALVALCAEAPSTRPRVSDIANPRRPQPPPRPAPAPPTNQTRARARMTTVFHKKAQKEEKERLSSSPWDDDGLRLDDAFALVIRQAPFRLSFPPLDFSRATRDPEISRELTFPFFETDSLVNLDADWAPPHPKASRGPEAG